MEIEKKELDNKKSLTMDDLTAGENFPEAKENAIEAVQQARAEELAEKKALENSGVKLKKDGTPAKKRGRKSSAEISSNGNADKGFYNPQNSNQTPPGAVRVDSIYASQVISGIIEQTTVKLISSEFKLTDEERLANVQAWKNALDASGGLTLTPVQALLLSHGAIIGTRLVAGKETQSKFALFGAWVKTKIAKWKQKRALSNSRENTKRENDIREEKGPKPEKTG